MTNFWKLIFLMLFLIQPCAAITQIKYDKYFELETSNELQYKTLSLEGFGVLVMESGVGIPEGKTTVNYTLLDNDLNVRGRTNVIYESEVYYNRMVIDSGFAYLVFVNDYGDFQFEKFDLINNKNSRFTINLHKVGELVYADFSLANPYVIRNHANIQYTITEFDLEAKTYNTEFIDISEMEKPFVILDSKISESGEKFMLIFEHDGTFRYEINLLERDRNNGKEKRIKIYEEDKDHYFPIIDCRFDGDDVVLISESNKMEPYPYRYLNTYVNSGISYQRFSNGALNNEKKYTSKDFENYTQLLKKIPLKGIIPNADYRRRAIPTIQNGQLIMRPNGHSFFMGYLFFHPDLYRLSSAEYKGRLYLMLLNFDQEGNLVWDRQIKMQAPKSSEKFYDNSMNMLYSTSDDSGESLILLYQNAKLTFLELTEKCEIHLKQHQRPIVKYHAKDKVKTSNSKIIYLYDRTFLHVGIKQIKNKSRNIPDYKYLLTLGKLEL